MNFSLAPPAGSMYLCRVGKKVGKYVKQIHSYHFLIKFSSTVLEFSFIYPSFWPQNDRVAHDNGCECIMNAHERLEWQIHEITIKQLLLLTGGEHDGDLFTARSTRGDGGQRTLLSSAGGAHSLVPEALGHNSGESSHFGGKQG